MLFLRNRWRADHARVRKTGFRQSLYVHNANKVCRQIDICGKSGNVPRLTAWSKHVASLNWPNARKVPLDTPVPCCIDHDGILHQREWEKVPVVSLLVNFVERSDLINMLHLSSSCRHCSCTIIRHFVPISQQTSQEFPSHLIIIWFQLHSNVKVSNLARTCLYCPYVKTVV